MSDPDTESEIRAEVDRKLIAMMKLEKKKMKEKLEMLERLFAVEYGTLLSEFYMLLERARKSHDGEIKMKIATSLNAAVVVAFTDFLTAHGYCVRMMSHPDIREPEKLSSSYTAKPSPSLIGSTELPKPASYTAGAMSSMIGAVDKQKNSKSETWTYTITQRF